MDDASLNDVLADLEEQRPQLIAQELLPAARSGSGVDPNETNAKKRHFYRVSGSNANAFPNRHPWLIEKDFGSRRAATSTSKQSQPKLASIAHAHDLAEDTVAIAISQPLEGSPQVKMT